MIKVLIFRTDRIGDLIVSGPTIYTISKYFKNAEITLISSNKNYQYAKRLDIFYEIIQFPRSGIISKIKFIVKLYKKEFDYIFIFDGKERSILASTFIKANRKVALTNTINFYYNFLNIKFFKDNETDNLNIIFQQMLNHCKINNEIENYNFLTQKKDNGFSLNLSIKDFLQIHLDEKWIRELYIDTYTDINPKYSDFITFLESLNKGKNIVITTGLIRFGLIDDLKSKYFNKVNEKVYIKKNDKKTIYLILEPSFEDIESLLRNSKILISCHGSIIHAANSFDVVKIDIIEKNKITFYKKFISYLESHSILYRSEFKLLSKEIIKKLLIQS